ncbi:MAG: phosphoribosyl-AMP cyclohydrolase [Thermonemataceae bacterium]
MRPLTFFFISLLFIAASCTQQPPQEKETTDNKEGNTIALYSSECITEAEVIKAQEEWGEGIVKIGKVYTDKGDYKQAAMEHIQDLYGYDLSSVLFKPTLASVDQFRGSFDGALSYFVGGNETYPEDKGFAIKPWTNVRWENSGIINNSCNMAVAMGNYYFTTTEGDEVKVEYTLGYVKDKDNKLRIVVHKSAMPYSPEK